LDALPLDTFPGLTDTLLRFPRRLVSALKGEEVEKWEPTFWEQEEREVDGLGKGSWQEVVIPEDDDDDDDDDQVVRKSMNDSPRLIRKIPAIFKPGEIPSHKRLLEEAVAAMLVLRNLSLNERNERIFLAYSRTINILICDIMSLIATESGQHLAKEWCEMQGIQEMQVYALDILEITRVRLHIRKRCSLAFDIQGKPLSFPVYSEPIDQDTAMAGSNSIEDEMIRAAKRAAAGTSDFLFNLLVWHLHTSSDRSILMGCLRCLGALAAEEKNEAAFVEVDNSQSATTRQNGARRLTGVTSTATITSPGILKRCLILLPLTQDSALLEAALDCLYQIINIGDNALRLATCIDDGVAPLGIGIGRPECGTEDGSERGIGDVRSIMRLLSRNLIYGRVVWDRTHQLTLHPALHGHVPSAVAARRKEKDEIYRKRRVAEGDDKERSKLRKLQRKEWMEIKDLPEPERLKAWMQLIYEPREGGEVTQMEFWTTYSNQFGPYATLGGPALQPAAEVIRTVSSVFPGALAMVIQSQKFIVRGVEARDRSGEWSAVRLD
jgi:chromatin structure-remodeling complex subunit RSC9